MEESSRKKKVLYLITKGNFGGAQRYVYDLATSLPKDRFETVVALGQGQMLKEKLREQNIRVIELANSQRDIDLKKDFGLFFEILRLLKSERPDVLHLNSSKIGGLGAAAGRLAKIKKIIFSGHGWAFNEERNSLSKAAILFLHWITVLLCHATIAVSEKAKSDICVLPFIKNKIKVIHNGISKFETLPQEEAREILLSGRDAGKKIIFSMSELHPNKGIDVAIKALSILPDEVKSQVVYRVAGDGEEKENLERMAYNYVSERASFAGFVPDAKKLLSGADIFLLPSRTEAFPYSLLEAGAAGVPIIATSVGGIPEVVRDMQNGILVHPKNPKEIAEAIMYLFDHPEKQKEFGGEIKKTVTNSFSLQKMLSETIAVYSGF